MRRFKIQTGNMGPPPPPPAAGPQRSHAQNIQQTCNLHKVLLSKQMYMTNINHRKLLSIESDSTFSYISMQ